MSSPTQDRRGTKLRDLSGWMLTGALFVFGLASSSLLLLLAVCWLDSPPQFTVCGRLEVVYGIEISDAQCAALPHLEATIEVGGQAQHVGYIDTPDGIQLYTIEGGQLIEPPHAQNDWSPLAVSLAFTPLFAIAALLVVEGLSFRLAAIVLDGREPRRAREDIHRHVIAAAAGGARA
jgi:hypothetical protein